MGLADIFSFGQFTSGQFSWQKNAFKAIGLARLPVCHPARQCRGPATVPRHTAIENMVLAVGDNAVTHYRQSLYNATRPTRHPATMTGHRQPEFAIGKVLVRLKVTRLTWECNRACFVGPRNCPLPICGKTAILRQSDI